MNKIIKSAYFWPLLSFLTLSFFYLFMYIAYEKLYYVKEILSFTLSKNGLEFKEVFLVKKVSRLLDPPFLALYLFVVLKIIAKLKKDIDEIVGATYYLPLFLIIVLSLNLLFNFDLHYSITFAILIIYLFSYLFSLILIFDNHISDVKSFVFGFAFSLSFLVAFIYAIFYSFIFVFIVASILYLIIFLSIYLSIYLIWKVKQYFLSKGKIKIKRRS